MQAGALGQEHLPNPPGQCSPPTQMVDTAILMFEGCTCTSTLVDLYRDYYDDHGDAFVQDC